MKVKVINSSSRKTREKIKKAFALLAASKGSLNKITVTELVAKADITRSAFYTHYDNIYEVAKEIQDEAIQILIQNIDNLQDTNNINNFFDELFNHLKENEEIYSMILSSNDPLLFMHTLNKIISKSLYDVLKDKHIKNLALNISLFIDGSINLVIKHYRKEIGCLLFISLISIRKI